MKPTMRRLVRVQQHYGRLQESVKASILAECASLERSIADGRAAPGLSPEAHAALDDAKARCREVRRRVEEVGDQGLWEAIQPLVGAAYAVGAALHMVG